MNVWRDICGYMTGETIDDRIVLPELVRMEMAIPVKLLASAVMNFKFQDKLQEFIRNPENFPY